MKKSPSIYTAEQIKRWSCEEKRIDASGREYWNPARPIHFASLSKRFRLAWGVFIGRYDALCWFD